jgi:hypothetical protein
MIKMITMIKMMIGRMIRDLINKKSILKSVLRNQINHGNQKNHSSDILRNQRVLKDLCKPQ